MHGIGSCMHEDPRIYTIGSTEFSLRASHQVLLQFEDPWVHIGTLHNLPHLIFGQQSHNEA